MNETTITFRELRRFFKENNLIVAPKEEIRAEIAIKQAAYLRKKFLSIGEVMDGKFFPLVKSRQTINNWLKNGKLKEGQDWMYDKKGRKVILTSYLKRTLNL